MVAAWLVVTGVDLLIDAAAAGGAAIGAAELACTGAGGAVSLSARSARANCLDHRHMLVWQTKTTFVIHLPVSDSRARTCCELTPGLGPGWHVDGKPMRSARRGTAPSRAL